MKIEEAKMAINTLKKEGFSDDQIIQSFAMMFINDKINIDILGALMKVLGYELDKEFLSLSTEQQKKSLKKLYGIR